MNSNELSIPDSSPKSYGGNNMESNDKICYSRCLRLLKRCFQGENRNRNSKRSSNLRTKFVHMFKHLWSFIIVMLILLVLALVLSGGSIWLINYFVNRSGVNDLATHGRELLLKRVRDYVFSQIQGGPATVQSLAKRFELEDRMGLNVSNQAIPRSRFITIGMLAAIMKYSLLDALFYSSDDNFFTSVVHNSTNSRQRSGVFLLRTSDGDGELITRRIDIDTLEVGSEVTNVLSPYYVTQRPFYTPVKQTLKTTWTQVYVSALQTNTLVISVSVPYLDTFNSSQLSGVFTATFRLGDMSRFLEFATNVTEEGARTYMVQPDFTLVGSSIGEVVSDSGTVLNAANHSDFVVAESAQYCLRHRLISNLASNHVRQDTFKTSDGRKRIIGLIAMRDQFGLDWTVITVSDQKVIFAAVTSSNKISLIVACCILIASVLITLLVSGIIMRPLKRICHELNKITNMEFAKVNTKICSFGLEEIDEMVEALVQMQHGLSNFARFVPSDLVKVLVQQNKIAKIGVVPRDITVMFANIYPLDYQAQDQLVDPKILVEMLQEVFTDLTSIIAQQSGIIDKYIGVTIMALFNAPTRVDCHEISAVTAAVLMQQHIEMLNERWRARDYPQLRIQIGINTAKCLVGNIGSSTRVSYTAVGDGVNVCSRLEGLNKRYHTRILIGHSTYRAVYAAFACRWISRVCVKGKTEPANIYEVLCAKESASPKITRLCMLHDEVKLAIESNNLDQARYILAHILEMNLDDYPARELYDRVMHPETFTNCVYMTQK